MKLPIGQHSSVELVILIKQFDYSVFTLGSRNAIALAQSGLCKGIGSADSNVQLDYDGD